MQENLVIRKPSVTDAERIAQAHSTASTAAPSLGHATGSPGWGCPAGLTLGLREPWLTTPAGSILKSLDKLVRWLTRHVIR